MKLPTNRIIRTSIRIRKHLGMYLFSSTQGMLISFVGTLTSADVWTKATLMIGWGSCLVVCNIYYWSHQYWMRSAANWKAETNEWMKLSDKWRDVARRNDQIGELNRLMYFTPPYKGKDN